MFHHAFIGEGLDIFIVKFVQVVIDFNGEALVRVAGTVADLENRSDEFVREGLHEQPDNHFEKDSVD